MKTITIGVLNRVFLDTEKTVDAVKISIVSGKGVYVKKSDGADIKDLSCTLDPESGKYYYDLTPKSDTVADYYYIVWSASYSGISVELEDEYTNEDCVIQATVAIDDLLVSPTFVKDHFLRGISAEEIAATYQQSYREAVRSEIKAATEQLETLTEVYFEPRLISDERHDYNMSPIYEKYWTNTLFHSPVISIEKASLKLNNIEVVQEIPSTWVQIGNAIEGTIKIMPYSGSYNGLMFVFQVGIGIAILLAGASYIPDFFAYDYYAGLDWDNLAVNEKIDIRNAIGRRVAMNMLPNLDVHRGLSSEAKAVDGVSKSVSYTSSAMWGEHSAAIEQYKFQETQWLNLFKKKYLTRLKVG